MEKKLILISKHFGQLAQIIHALTSLLRPLKWSFVNISFVSNDFLDSIESPFPCIIGVSKEIWEHHFQILMDSMNYDEFFLQNTIIFDIEEDIII